MKQFYSLDLRSRAKDILFAPSDNTLLKFFRYLLLSVVVTLAEAIVTAFTVWLFAANPIATAAGAVTGFVTGWILFFMLSKKFVFTEKPAKLSRRAEFMVYGLVCLIAALIGSLLTMIVTEWLWNFGGFVAAVLVFAILTVYRYLTKQFILYRK